MGLPAHHALLAPSPQFAVRPPLRIAPRSQSCNCRDSNAPTQPRQPGSCEPVAWRRRTSHVSRALDLDDARALLNCSVLTSCKQGTAAVWAGPCPMESRHLLSVLAWRNRPATNRQRSLLAQNCCPPVKTGVVPCPSLCTPGSSPKVPPGSFPGNGSKRRHPTDRPRAAACRRTAARPPPLDTAACSIAAHCHWARLHAATSLWRQRRVRRAGQSGCRLVCAAGLRKRPPQVRKTH